MFDQSNRSLFEPSFKSNNEHIGELLCKMSCLFYNRCIHLNDAQIKSILRTAVLPSESEL